MNEATVNGDRYVIRKATHRNAGTCAGCAAMDPRLLETEQRGLCRKLPPCQPGRRDDGKFVIWVKEP